MNDFLESSPSVEVPQRLVDMSLPQMRDLATRLRFVPDEGRIWMDDHRMVLLQADAYADLRAELIASLGLEMTRGLLTRVYYAAGQRDAERAIKLAGPRASLQTLLESGGMMHALHGYLFPEKLGRGFALNNLSADDYYGEAIWKESVEDEIHIARHGVGTHAACWGAVGYTSGFLSRCAGRGILVREVECRSSGSDHCRVVAKPFSQWEDADDDLRFLQVEPAPPVRVHLPLSTYIDSSKSDVAPWVHAPDKPVLDSGSSMLVGVSTAFSILQHKIACVAPTLATVLLLGESGVGKSLVAREIHQNSQRAEAAFVEVNCAAIPESLMESELFGVERGAFTGAAMARSGRFEAAHEGTLFLDEISSLSMTAQGKLLRVLQNGEFERLGSNKTRVTSVRVIAATNEDLKVAVSEGRFREDLYFRLNVFPLVIQPLRERRDDVPLLAQRLLERFAERHSRQVTGITSRAMQALMYHTWPGNVRELENVLERAVIMAQHDTLLDIHHLSNADANLAAPSFFGVGKGWHLTVNEGDTAPAEKTVDESATMPDSLAALAEYLIKHGWGRVEELEDALVEAALLGSEGNVTKAADLLGFSRSQMDYRNRKRRKSAQ